jgi:ABC-2 type transport system ATP-binding protein
VNDSRPAAVPVLELDGLSVRLGRRDVLRRLEARLHGQAIGLLGPNGAGKTTLLNTLLGFHQPQSGTARVLGLDIHADARRLRGQLGYMPESDAFVATMTGVRFVRMLAELSGLPAEAALERAHEALFYVGLGEARYRPISGYSLGMRQMVKLAQAIAHGPGLLLLDEPTNGLDPPARRRMIKLIRDLRKTAGVRVIVSSHLLRDVEESCDEVLILKDGRVAAVCDLEAERRANKKFLELEIAGGAGVEDAAARFATAAELLGCESVVLNARRLKLVLPEGSNGDLVPKLYGIAQAQGSQLRRLSSKRDSLEDIFLRAMDTDVDEKPLAAQPAAPPPLPPSSPSQPSAEA